MELDEGRRCQICPSFKCPHHGTSVRVLCQRGHVEHIAVAAGTKNNRMTGVGCELTGDEVTHHNTFTAFFPVSLGDDQIHHFVVGEDFYGPQVDLALQCGCCGQLQLLAGLPTGVIGAGHLHTAERAGG